RAWLFRAGRMLLVAGANQPGAQERLFALASRFERLGDTKMARALFEAADGNPARARRLLMDMRAAQLGAKPIDRDHARFGKVVTEAAQSSAGAPVVKINGAEIPRAEWDKIEQARDRTLALYRAALEKPSLRNKTLDGLGALRSMINLGRAADERMAL